MGEFGKVVVSPLSRASALPRYRFSSLVIYHGKVVVRYCISVLFRYHFTTLLYYCIITLHRNGLVCEPDYYGLPDRTGRIWKSKIWKSRLVL